MKMLNLSYRNIPKCLVLFCIVTLESTSVAYVVKTQSQATMYLATFGYLQPPQENTSSTTHEVAEIPDSVFKKAIKDFQSFAGIKKTGILDAETLRYMNENRCGMSDKISQPGRSWSTKHLTYRISRYNELLRKSDVDGEVARAFQMWSDVSGLTFTPRTSGRVNIDIGFYSGNHDNEGPLNAFDGRGGVLAHAYYPQSGSTHFDVAENWTINVTHGVNLFQVAVHEFGHALGLPHTEGVRESIMAPFFKGYIPQVSLHRVDIENIQKMYGPKSTQEITERPTTTYNTRPTTPSTQYTYNTRPTTPTPQYTYNTRPTTQYTTRSTTKQTTTSSYDDISELCRDGKFDAIFSSKEFLTYVFKDDIYWEVTPRGIAPGYPQRISNRWRGLPSHIDAAFTYRNGKTYFFKGSQYWRFNGTRMDPGYPKYISDPIGFPGIPNDIDAAFSFNGEKGIFFFKDRMFWKFHPDKDPHIEEVYPRNIAAFWRGLPERIDSGLLYRDRNAYIFKDNAYYRVDKLTLSVVHDEPPYPREVTKYWFNCSGELDARQGSGFRGPNTSSPGSFDDLP